MCTGKDRFRFDDKEGNGTWICNQCGAGAGVKLVCLVNDWAPEVAYKEIRKHLGNSRVRRVEPEKPTDRHVKVWSASVPVTPYDPVERYLSCREVFTSDTPLRWHADLDYWEDRKKVGTYHAMIAPVQAPDGTMTTVHVTYLDNGKKAPVPSPRKILGPPGKGSAVRLMKHGFSLGIAEGIETAIAAWKLFGLPTWAALNANMLEQWEPPKQVKDVVIYADNDKSFTGQAAAYSLGKRLRSRGITANVAMPKEEGDDWLDVLNHKRRH